jgi:glycosyltransferase involved in cell wall biosynthesis
MLEQLADSLEVGRSVVFTGYVAEPRDLYHLMDVFVLASAHEAFGLVLVEAMLCGTPVVGTRVGGIPHVLKQGEAGVLAPPDHPEVLADEIIALLRDETRRNQLIAAGRQWAQSQFSADRYSREIDEIYTELASGKRQIGA